MSWQIGRNYTESLTNCLIESIDQLSKFESFMYYTDDLYKELRQIEELQEMGSLYEEVIQEKIEKQKLL